MPLRSHNLFQETISKSWSKINPYVDKLTEARQKKSLPVLLGSDLRDQKGKWLSTFQALDQDNRNFKKLILEVGIHKGVLINQFAQTYSEDAFVGMDITYKRVFLSAQKAKQNNLCNLLCVLANAKKVDELFEEKELDGVVVFFPDPWSKKKRQLHNRLIDKHFCLSLKKILKMNGFFWLKTDDKHYFSEVAKIFEEIGFCFETTKQGILSERCESIFEQRFREKNVRIYEGVWLNS